MDLIPIPLRPDLQVPTTEDPKELKKFIADLVKDYNRLYAILRQDVNRLSSPAAAGRDLAADVDLMGYVLALVCQGFTWNPSANMPLPPAPVYNPAKLDAFLRAWAGRQ